METSPSITVAVSPGLASTVCAAAAGVAAAWTSAGSLGLLGHPLRHALTWLTLGLAILFALPPQRSWQSIAAVVAAAAMVVILTASSLPVVNVLAVGLLLSVLCLVNTGAVRTTLGIAAMAAVVLAVYRLAYTSIPLVWYAADAVGGALGWIAGALIRKPLRVGASFGGVDYLVVTAALFAGWLMSSSRPRAIRMALVLVAVVAAHLLYLAAVAWLSAAWPAATSHEPLEEAQAWTLRAALPTLVPWNLPALAAIVHLIIAIIILRLAARSPNALDPAPPGRRLRRSWVTIGLALSLPALVTVTLGRCDLKDRKIVFYEKGFLNWSKPQHGDYGRLSIGMYGMMPQYIESLGGRCVISPELSEGDLRDAHCVVLLFPNQPWKEGQLERLWRYVHNGGSLLVMGEHSTKEVDVPWERGGNRYNEALTPTKMRVAFDSAQFAIGGWLQSYQPMAHPATAGVQDQRNEFGVVIGGSIEARWPASPLLVGRFGWNDPGDEKSERAMMGNDRYDPGERLGDVILAAEQRVGRGRVIAFGDTSSLTNGITLGAHPFTSRLLSYMADPAASPQALWRQLCGTLLAAVLIVLLASRTNPATLVLGAGAMALATIVSAVVSERTARVLPDGSSRTPNRLAYIDISHLSAASEESWRNDGAMGLGMTLMRDGYLVLTLPESNFERISRAAIVVTVGPNRPFSDSERRAVRRFVEEGGTFICTTGYEQRAGSQSLLQDFGFGFGEAGDPRPPAPMGHFKSPYVDLGGSFAFVRFHAGWPIYCIDPNARVIAYGPGNKPVILMRRIGSGKFVLVGDTGFAMNKNLEREGGQPFEGMRENADFWRWFLPVLTDQPQWLPSPTTHPATTEPATQPAETEPAT